MNSRKNLIIFLVVTSILLSTIGVLSYKTAKLQKDIAALELLQRELIENSATLAVMSQSVKNMQKRLEDGRNRNFVSEIEKINGDLNMTKAMKKVNSIGNKKEGVLNVNRYELRYEGVDINSATNLFYRLTNAPLLIRVERCNLSVSFDNPNLLNISLSVAHIN